MDFQEILDSSFWGNTIENYLWFSGIILLAVVFKRFISKKLGNLIFKLFKKDKSDGVGADHFFELMIKPVEFLIVLVGLSFAVSTLNFPDPPEEELGLGGVIDLLIQISIVVSVTWSLLRLIDFFGLVLLLLLLLHFLSCVGL